MNQTFAIESFISFCDDMMIAEEGFKELGTKALKYGRTLIDKFILMMRKISNALKMFIKSTIQKLSSTRYVNPKVYHHAAEVYHKCDNIMYNYFLFQYDYSQERQLSERNIPPSYQLRYNIDKAIEAHSPITSSNVQTVINEIVSKTKKAIEEYDGFNRVKKEWEFLTPEYIKKMKEISTSKDYQSEYKTNITHSSRSDFGSVKRSNLMYDNKAEDEIENGIKKIQKDMNQFLKYVSDHDNCDNYLPFHLEAIVHHVLKESQEFLPYLNQIVICWNMYLLEYQKCDAYNSQMYMKYIDECGNVK